MRRIARSFWLSWVLLGVSVACTIGLKSLPYSTSFLEKGIPSKVDLPPTPDGFRVGSLVWNTTSYARTSKLEPYREVYYRACRRKEIGLAAAVRISNLFVERFPNGQPRFELFETDYDPVNALYVHLGGAGGHCVTRAGLLAATLLSVGIPARMIQVIGPDGGHNIIEVWDGPEGWVMFDPTKGVAFRSKDHPQGFPHRLSACEALRVEGEILREKVGHESRGGDLSGLLGHNFFKGLIIYPEPWLYTRVVPKSSGWPFRGKFVSIGPEPWNIGPAQFFLRCGIIACCLVLFLQASLFVVWVSLQGLNDSGHVRRKPR